MNELPLVSIITIVYNGEKYVHNAIESVLNQSYQNIEYIVVDGGSTDNTLSILKKYEQSIHSLVSEKDKGISDAFNKGLKKAKGEIVGILNADDWYETYTVQEVVENFTDSDIVYGDMLLWKNGKIDFRLQGNHEFLPKEMTINHPTVFVRKNCYDMFGVFDENYVCAMDYDILLRLYVNNCRFKYIHKVLANMRWAGLSDSRWQLGCRETLVIKNKYLPHRKLRNQLYYYKHIMAIGLPKLLTKIHLNFLTKIYRENFSRIKKTY
jgi:glycosyltransferase involved in cell wall biosynthesis